MTDLLRIAMLLEEEKIAWFILAVYDVEINYEVIYEAVRLNYYELLHYIWAFEKNVFKNEQNEKEDVKYVVLFDLIIIMNEK